ncbi:MAG: hypothetical protein ACYCQI_11335 [Gammaproteobacteria bacterium]
MRNRKAPAKQKDVNYLVANYDSCAVTVYGTHPKLISKPFIAFAAESNFDGFYGLSGRHFSLDLPNEKYHFLDHLPYMASLKTKSSGKSIYSKDAILKNYTTTAITVNFSEATGLECQGVSTGEDLVKGRHCNDGFVEVIEPYELKGIEPASDKRIHVADLKKAGINLSKSKNPLLTQIAQDAADKNPDCTIHLNVAIANKYCADAAKDAWKDPSWPKNVIINVYRVYGEGDRAEILPIFKMSPKQIAELKKRKVRHVEEKEQVAAALPEIKKEQAEIKSPPASMFQKPKTSLLYHSTFSRRVTRSMTKAAEDLLDLKKSQRKR